ncbi:polyamine oxidase 1-like, partial [Anneissia japonica]|uniref:polyamine oxidase 1-like n=1 Tax=Anneissia japonica TaxID=1529436 RepID=UPI00142552C0
KNIILNKKVTTIDQSSGDVVVVTCDNGEIFNASRVLVTVSCAILQNNGIEFIPDLPDWKIRTINRFRMASYSKIYLKFPINFWGDREILLRPSNHRGRYPIFTNFEAKGLFPVGTNILMAELTGAESLRVEALADEAIKAEIETVLREIFGEDTPNATDILVSGWSRNPLTLGAYSIWPPEMEQECFVKMQSRVNNVFFAGEYTSEDNGFVQGALESGEREGIKITLCRNRSSCPHWPANQSCFCGPLINLDHNTATMIAVKYKLLFISLLILFTINVFDTIGLHIL